MKSLPVVVMMTVLLGTCLWPAVAAAEPAEMSRQEIRDLADSGVGFSYWWGGAAWTLDPDADRGSCVGNCPSCTHSGSYGADCSGFVGKVWQVPGPIALETNSHPYATLHFRWNSYHWSQLDDWDDAVSADAFVYRNSSDTAGHIFLYDSGDPWGQVNAWECVGCSYGCIYGTRSVGSTYVAVRRDNINGAAAAGTLRGVVFVDRGQGYDNMDERVPGAEVSIQGHGSTLTSAEGANWSFTLPPGDYTVTARALGFDEATRTCTVTDGATTWCSLGVTPQETCVPDCGGRECGADSVCGESCGSCGADEVCTAQGICELAVCVADCSGRECGPDLQCGESCGTCGGDEVCGADGQCAPPACSPVCGERECGPDPVCGVPCGTCGFSETCNADGQCEVPTVCVPACGERECGPDPECGESCGECPDGWMCGATGVCLCPADCGPRVCGPDPVCGAPCGECPEGQLCTEDGACETVVEQGCDDPCAGRTCGVHPVCGDTCGRCHPERFCDDAGRCQTIDDEHGKIWGRAVRAPQAGGIAASQPLAGVTVSLADGRDQRADIEGYWEFLVEPGSWVVTATTAGGETATTTCTVDAGANRECVITFPADNGEPQIPPGDLVSAAKGGSDGCAAGPSGSAGGAALLLALLALLALRRVSRNAV